MPVMQFKDIITEIHTLYRASGYADHEMVAQSTSLSEIRRAMQEDYEKFQPEEWLDESREMSYIDDTCALLYCNRENVYEWLISTVNISDFAENCKPNQIFWAKTDDRAILPTKKPEDAGYDIYSKYRNEEITIQPGQTVMIPTGLCSAFHRSKVAILKERGSTGKIGLGQRSGVIDSGYRGEWIIPITNHSTVPVIMTPDIEAFRKSHAQADTMFTLYDLNKAICQVLFLDVPEMESCEISLHNLKNLHSARGAGRFGSSGK